MTVLDQSVTSNSHEVFHEFLNLTLISILFLHLNSTFHLNFDPGFKFDSRMFFQVLFELNFEFKFGDFEH